MTTYKLFRVSATGDTYAKAFKTLVDPTGPHTEAREAAVEKYGEDVAFRIFEVLADGTLKEFGVVADGPTECVNGHLRAEWWTVTKGGRKYCRKCATEASKRSKQLKKAARILADAPTTVDPEYVAAANEIKTEADFMAIVSQMLS